MRQTGEQHALQSDPSERIDQLARRDSATRDMGTDRCPIDVEAVEPKWNWPEFEIRVQSRLIVSRPYSSPRPIDLDLPGTQVESDPLPRMHNSFESTDRYCHKN